MASFQDAPDEAIKADEANKVGSTFSRSSFSIEFFQSSTTPKSSFLILFNLM